MRAKRSCDPMAKPCHLVVSLCFVTVEKYPSSVFKAQMFLYKRSMRATWFWLYKNLPVEKITEEARWIVFILKIMYTSRSISGWDCGVLTNKVMNMCRIHKLHNIQRSTAANRLVHQFHWPKPQHKHLPQSRPCYLSNTTTTTCAKSGRVHMRK